MERGFAVQSAINPKQLDRFRDRISPAGAKDDRGMRGCWPRRYAPTPPLSAAAGEHRPSDRRVAGVVQRLSE